MKKEDLVNVWKLISFRIFWSGTDKELHPYGFEPKGYIIYTPDDYVSVHIMRADRPKCSSENFLELTTEEMREIALHSGGYVGRYEIRPDHIIHYPIVSSFPNFIYKPQIRRYTLNESKLILECDYPVEYDGISGCSQLTWERSSI